MLLNASPCILPWHEFCCCRKNTNQCAEQTAKLLNQRECKCEDQSIVFSTLNVQVIWNNLFLSPQSTTLACLHASTCKLASMQDASKQSPCETTSRNSNQTDRNCWKPKKRDDICIMCMCQWNGSKSCPCQNNMKVHKQQQTTSANAMTLTSSVDEIALS